MSHKATYVDPFANKLRGLLMPWRTQRAPQELVSVTDRTPLRPKAQGLALMTSTPPNVKVAAATQTASAATGADSVDGG